MLFFGRLSLRLISRCPVLDGLSDQLSDHVRDPTKRHLGDLLVVFAIPVGRIRADNEEREEDGEDDSADEPLGAHGAREGQGRAESEEVWPVRLEVLATAQEWKVVRVEEVVEAEKSETQKKKFLQKSEQKFF